MTNRDNQAVCLRQFLKRNQVHAILLLCDLCVRPGICDERPDLVFSQPPNDVHDLAVSGIRAILLKGDAQNDDIGLLGRKSGLDHLLDRSIGHIGTHAVVDLSAVEDDLAVIAQLFGGIGQVVRIHADAMATDQSRLEAQRVPLGVHAVDHLIGINAHAVADHGDFVHERNVDVALTVFHDLDRFRSPDSRYGNRSGIDDNVINLLDDPDRLLIHARYDLADIR